MWIKARRASGPFFVGEFGNGGDTVAKSKYDPTLIPAIEMWARDGLIESEIAKKLGIGYSTLSLWKTKYVEIVEALKTNKEAADARVEKALYTKALDGDTTAQIFWLKNRQPGKWRDKRDIGVEGQVVIDASFGDLDETDKV